MNKQDLLVSVSKKAPTLAEAKKVLREDEKAKEAARIQKAKVFRARKDKIQKEIDGLIAEKDKQLADISDEQKKLKAKAADVVEKFDAKVAKLNARLHATQAKAVKTLKIKPKDMKNVPATNV